MTVPTHGPERGAGPAADPACLTPHPFALLHFPLGPEADDAELIESVRELGVQRPLTVTGERCASPPGTVLNGNRRRRGSVAGGVTEVPVRVLDDLTANDEERIVLSENLADQQGRRLTESQRAQLEHELAKRLGKGQGHRSDLGTSAGSSGGGDTRDRVAAALGASRNSVADRRTIFFSPVSAPALKSAVDAGTISRSHAAELVRHAEKMPAVASVLGSTTPGIHQRSTVLANATAWVEQQLHAVKSPGSGRPKRSKAQSAKTAEIDLAACPTDVSVAGRQLRLELNDGRLRIEDLGPDIDGSAPGPFVWPEKPWSEKVTATNWVHAVHRAVDRFPDDLRADITLGSVFHVPPESCPTCLETKFSQFALRCVVCAPPERHEPTVNLRSSRTQVLITVRGCYATAEVPITYWTNCRDAGLYWEDSTYGVIQMGRRAFVVLGGKREMFNKSLEQVYVTTVKTLLGAMNQTHGVWNWRRRNGSEIIWRSLDGWMSFVET